MGKWKLLPELFKCWTGLMMSLPGELQLIGWPWKKPSIKITKGSCCEFSPKKIVSQIAVELFSRLAPNEEETAAERCSEKLVDLVVLLTTKVLFIFNWRKKTIAKPKKRTKTLKLSSLTTTLRIWGRSWRTTSTRTLRGEIFWQKFSDKFQNCKF